MQNLVFKEEAFRLVGAALEVYNHLGNGFLEAVYQEAYELELKERGISFESQVNLPIHFKSHELKKKYRADLITFGSIIVELKAQKCLTPTDQSVMLNYLSATKLRLGLLFNFGADKSLEWKRMVL